MSSLHYHEPPWDFSPERVSQHLGWLASQDKGLVLTSLALLALRAVLRSSGPRLTRHRTRVNHACPLRLPFTLDVELGRETVFHRDLATLVLRALVETSLVARISVVHQSPKPKPQRQGFIALHKARLTRRISLIAQICFSEYNCLHPCPCTFPFREALLITGGR